MKQGWVLGAVLTVVRCAPVGKLGHCVATDPASASACCRRAALASIWARQAHLPFLSACYISLMQSGCASRSVLAEFDEARLHAKRGACWQQCCHLVSALLSAIHGLCSHHQQGCTCGKFAHAAAYRHLKVMSPCCRRFWQWQIGMLMFVIGNIANFVARGT